MGASISGDAINQMVKLRAQQAGIKGRRITAHSMRWTLDVLWRAYEKLGVAQGNGGRKGVPELMSGADARAGSASCPRNKHQTPVDEPGYVTVCPVYPPNRVV